MNTTTNTRGVSEAMVALDRALEAVNAPLITDKANERAAWEAVSVLQSHGATLRAALSAEPAAQPEDSRCPPTYRREEAVKALIGKGWTWDGKAWAEPAAQGEGEPVADLEPFREAIVFACTNGNMDKWRRVLASFDSFAYRYKRNTHPAPPAQPAEQGEAVYYEKRDWHHDGGWHRIDKATFEQYENYHKRFGGKSPVRALGVIAPPAQPAGRVPEGWKLVPVEATDDMLKAAYPLHWWDGPGQRLKQDYRKLVDASPAPSEGVKGVEG